MAIFGSQRKRNKRLFNDAFELMAHCIVDQDWEPKQKNMHLAWISGGSAGANHALDNCEDIKRLWKKGDGHLAVKLSQVFTMPVVVRFFRFESKMAESDKQRRRELIENGINNVLRIVEEAPLPPEETSAEYIRVQRQYEFDMDMFERGQVPYQFIEMYYVLSRALVVLGDRSDFSLGSVALPVNDLEEFLAQGGKLTDGQDFSDYAAMSDAVQLGLGVASETFRSLGKQVE